MTTKLIKHCISLLARGLLVAPLLWLFQGAAVAQDSPVADAVVLSVTPAGEGRYDMTGIVLNDDGVPACGLAMASGRCVFSCGPGSLRCEGGQASSPLGEFELFNLPTEANGTISLQAFVQGHVGSIESVDPGNFGGPELPPPGAEASTYIGQAAGSVIAFSACATLSAGADALVGGENGGCDGDKSFELEIEVEIGGPGLGDEERCQIIYDTDERVPVENGGFTIQTPGGELIVGQFVSATRLVGTAVDTTGECVGAWFANRLE